MELVDAAAELAYRIAVASALGVVLVGLILNYSCGPRQSVGGSSLTIRLRMGGNWLFHRMQGSWS